MLDSQANNPPQTMVQILATDEYGLNYVACSFQTAQEAYDNLREALDNAETLPEARRLAGALEQAAEMLQLEG